MGTVSVRLDEDEERALERLLAGRSKSDVLRELVVAAAGADAVEVAGPPRELGRVDLVVPVRPESVAALDAAARAQGWNREQMARQWLSMGRRAWEAGVERLRWERSGRRTMRHVNDPVTEPA
jgi:hypothetical protein